MITAAEADAFATGHYVSKTAADRAAIEFILGELPYKVNGKVVNESGPGTVVIAGLGTGKGVVILPVGEVDGRISGLCFTVTNVVKKALKELYKLDESEHFGIKPRERIVPMALSEFPDDDGVPLSGMEWNPKG